MAFYNVCPKCNGNLDPGERCTCEEEKEMEKKRISSLFKVSSSGQMVFDFTEGKKIEKAVI